MRGQVGFERSATRDDVRVTLSLETLEEVRDAGGVTRVNSNSHVSKVCVLQCIAATAPLLTPSPPPLASPLTSRPRAPRLNPKP